MANLLIIKNLPMSATVVAKEIGSPTPVVLQENDTARAYFVNKETGEAISLPNDGGKDLTVTDAEHGKFTLSLTAEETALFPYDSGFREDGAKALDTCKCLINFSVASLPADSKAIVYEVYVEDMGL